MRFLPRIALRSMTAAIAVYQRMFMDVRVWGRERIPRGPKIFAVNHITSTDAYWILPVFREPVHLVLGPHYQFRWLGRLLDEMEMISALPGDTKRMMELSEKYLRRGESLVIAPEGDIQAPFSVGALQPGIAAIYRRTPVPIVPMALVAPRRHRWELPLRHHIGGHVFRTVVVVRGPFCIHIGEPFAPPIAIASRRDQTEVILTGLRDRLQQLVDQVRTDRFWDD